MFNPHILDYDSSAHSDDDDSNHPDDDDAGDGGGGWGCIIQKYCYLILKIKLNEKEIKANFPIN